MRSSEAETPKARSAVAFGQTLRSSEIAQHFSVSARRTHLQNPSIKDDRVRVFLSGRDRPYRQDFHAPTKLLPQTIQSPGRPGMSPTRSDDFQRSHPSRHQCQRDPQVATDLPGSIACNLAGFRSGKSGTKASNGVAAAKLAAAHITLWVESASEFQDLV